MEKYCSKKCGQASRFGRVSTGSQSNTESKALKVWMLDRKSCFRLVFQLAHWKITLQQNTITFYLKPSTITSHEARTEQA
jgi:hypothetical protein